MTAPKKATSPFPNLQGTFNGVELEKIIWVRMVTTGNGKVLRSFRTTNQLRELEGCLRLGAFAVLELPGEVIEGRVIAYDLHTDGEYEVTLEVILDKNTSHQ